MMPSRWSFPIARVTVSREVPTRLAGWENLAFTGQFCEQPDDVVFTVEYSAYVLLGLKRELPAVFKG